MRVQPSVLRACTGSFLMPRAARVLVEDVVFMGVLPVLASVGVVTNVVNCVVFRAQGLGDRVNLCLFCLCLADILFLTALSIRHVDKTFQHVTPVGWRMAVWVPWLVRNRLVAVHTGFGFVSTLVTTVISVERCVCVTWPLRAATMMTAKRLGVVLVVISVLGMAGRQFMAFPYDVACAVTVGREHLPPYFLVVPSQLYRRHPTLVKVLDTFVFSALLPTLSLGVVAVSTAVTVLKLRQASKWRSVSAAGTGAAATSGATGSHVINRKEKALTRMLVAISLVYITCLSPQVARALSRFLFPEFNAWGRWCNLVIATEAMAEALLAANSSLNFFLFYYMGSRYQATLRRLCRRCSARGHDAVTSAKPVSSAGATTESQT